MKNIILRQKGVIIEDVEDEAHMKVEKQFSIVAATFHFQKDYCWRNGHILKNKLEGKNVINGT